MAILLTADRAIDVLEAVAAARDGVGTREMARHLKLNVATVHNLAKTLESRGYLRQAADSRRFFPSVRLMLLGRHDQYLESLTVLGRPHVERLAAELDESVMLGALDRGQVINLHYVPSRQALRVQEPEDLRPVAHCTALGKLMLAHMPAQHLDAYLKSMPRKRFTDRTITSRQALIDALVEIRRQGFSSARDELCEGVSAMATGIRDPWGTTVAALGASAPTLRLQSAEQQDVTRRALEAAARQVEQAWARPR